MQVKRGSWEKLPEKFFKGKRVFSPAAGEVDRNRFTLIELLVVIAIIAILAGMLLPALNMAREKGRAIVCMNNFSSLGKALQMYLSDYQEHYPCYWNSAKGHNGGSGKSCFGGGSDALFTSYLALKKNGQPIGRIAKKGTRGPFTCPTRKGIPTIDLYTIGINYHSFSVSDSDNMTSLRWTKHPSFSAYMGETNYYQNTNFLTFYIGRWNGTVGYFHSKKTNMLFCDGHVASLHRNQVSYSSATWKGTLFWWHAARHAGDETSKLSER